MMHIVTLEYPQDKEPAYCDALTHAAVTELFLRGIHASQNSHNTIILHDARDLTAALLLLSASSAYTAKILSKPTI